MRIDGVVIPEERVQALCRRHHIRRLAVFGSLVRGDLRPESDIDVLVEFESGQTPGFRFFTIQDELSELLGRSVDLNTSAFLSPSVRRRAAKEAKVIYEGA